MPRPCRRCLSATSQSLEENAPWRFAGGSQSEDTLRALTATPQADGPRPGLSAQSAADSGAHLPQATTQMVTTPSRLPPAAPAVLLSSHLGGGYRRREPGRSGACSGGGALASWAGPGKLGGAVGGGAIRAALGFRAAPSRAGGSGRGARQRREDWLRRAETSGSRGPSGRPARRGAVGSSGLVTETCSRPCRPLPQSLGCAAVAGTRRRAPRRLQPRGLRSPRLPHAHHDED